MSLLDGLSSQLGAALGSDPATLLQHASELIQSHPGGLQGLIDQFHAAGLSEQVSSWLGSGSNLPISADQLQSVLGSGPVAALAAKLGIPADQAMSQLATVMPSLIDHATPDGQVGSSDLLNEGLAMLKGKLFG